MIGVRCLISCDGERERERESEVTAYSMLDVRLIFDHISDMQALNTFINCYTHECSKSVFMEIRSLPTIG